MERRRLIIIILAAVAIILLIGLSVWLFWPKPKPEVQTNQPPVDSVLEQQLKNLPPTEQAPEDADGSILDLKQMAFAFAERYGSYSTDLRFKNLTDLKPLMTDNFINLTDRLIADLAPQTGLEYVGYETKALSSDLTYYADGLATVSVRTQRSYYQGDNDKPEIFYQNLILKLIKDGEIWKVDQADWENTR